MSAIRTIGLSHVNVEVTDFDRALAFYRRFGLEEVRREGAARAGAWFRFPQGQELHIAVGPAPAHSRAHFAIYVDDLAVARRVMEEAGAPIEMEREIPGLVRFFARDPDGNRIEIVQRLQGQRPG